MHVQGMCSTHAKINDNQHMCGTVLSRCSGMCKETLNDLKWNGSSAKHKASYAPTTNYRPYAELSAFLKKNKLRLNGRTTS